MAKIVVIYSGGMDSFTVLNKAVTDNHNVYALSFDYGQKHNKELIYATQACQDLNIAHKILEIQSIASLFTSSSLTSHKINLPDGHYDSSNMVSTVVPNRNMILISLAIAYAVNIGAEGVWYGAHAGDHLIYPDCRPAFVDIMDKASKIANFEPVYVHAPYLKTDKIGILKAGLAMQLDYSKTWTCYKGLEKACGTCGSCLERLEAFNKNNLVDPMQYA